ncbi:MAG TPA: FAD-dependent oxidoreductase [Burkholderiales bacterium]|nr:FAD-dependent oxidoreductase [Burkholderiales bacterium]
MSHRRLLVAVLLLGLIAAFFALDLGQYLRLEYFRSQQSAIEEFRRADPFAAGGVFFLIYVAVTALSLPGAAVMSLAVGAIFGLAWGTLIVSFASSVGATLAFLSSRFLFRESVRGRFGERLRAIDAGLEKEGAFYLFALRLVPAFPYVVVNLVMGVTPIRVWTFYWVSQIGMLPATIVYVNAGTQLATLTSIRGLLSPELIGSLALLGIFPLIAKRAVEAFKARRRLARWPKPAKFDRNLVVIGAGSAGLVSAYIAAAVKAKVTLIEKDRMGGDCLNTGCVPSKALIKSARLIAQAKRAREFGLKSMQVEFDFADVMERVQRVVRTVEPHDSAERYTNLGVECIRGEAKITSPWTVEVKTETDVRSLTTRAIVIAAGARPFVPPIPGLAEVGCLTSDSVWDLRVLPRRLVVLGGGPIGCELAQCFARFGARVTQVEMLPRILIREDPEISEMVARQFREERVDVRTDHKALRVVREEGEKMLVCEHGGKEIRIPFDELLCAVGRVANTAGYGLEELGIGVSRARTVETNEYLQTLYTSIYACGDVAGPYQFTHTASHQAWYAAVNALFGGVKRFRADYSVIPWATFTDPEVARVGLNETEAKEKNIAYDVTTYPFEDLDRAIADGETQGAVKVLTAPGRDRILGATVAGEHAADLIVEFIMAMKHGIGLNKILGTIHIYPTLAEANKYAAGSWKWAHAPQGPLRWVEKFHAWRRG